MGFSKFMASNSGRAVRVLAGVALIVVGGILGGGWWALAVVGLVPRRRRTRHLPIQRPLRAATQRQSRPGQLTDHQEAAGPDPRTRRHALIREAAT